MKWHARWWSLLLMVIHAMLMRCSMTFVYNGLWYIQKRKIFKCYSSENLIALNSLHEAVHTWYSFHSWVDWNNADKVSCSRTQHTDAWFEPSTYVSRNRHSNHMTNMLKYGRQLWLVPVIRNSDFWCSVICSSLCWFVLVCEGLNLDTAMDVWQAAGNHWWTD